MSRGTRLRVLGVAALVGGVLAAGFTPAESNASVFSVRQKAPESRLRQGAAPGATAAAGQPYAPNWFPEDLLTWSPGSDPDAEYNRSGTPLGARLVDPLTTANAEAKARKVMALSVFANTDGNPSQGSPNFDYYTSEFWQYIDTLVFWGGSSSEGLILAPNPTVADAAHRNGVPVLGTVFLPPSVYGGKFEWTQQLLRRDASGRFPAAAKLAEIARFYGFEGWFINAETEGGDATTAADMRAFLADLKARGSKVLWYDSMVESGEIDWQNELNSLNDDFFKVSDLTFLNYGWNTTRLTSSAALAQSLGRSPSDLHAGIDVGWRQFAVQPYFDTLFPATGESGISAGLYRPDFTLTGTDDKTQYAARESRFWVGSDGDPSKSTADAEGWKGVSSKVAETTPVLGLPFVTNFNTGHGKSWWQDGKRWQTGDYNNLTTQDLLPTWRWQIKGSPLTIDYDYSFAYRGGSSLNIRGPITGNTDIPLYATRFAVNRNQRLSVTSYGRAEHSVILRFADAPNTDVVVGIGGQQDGSWATRSFSLARWEGRTLIRVGLRLSKPAELTAIDYHLGRLAILEGTAALPTAPTTVRVARADAGARITWARSSSGAMRYDVEAVNATGARTWLGSSTSGAFYASSLPADAVRVEVVPVGKAHQRGPAGAANL